MLTRFEERRLEAGDKNARGPALLTDFVRKVVLDARAPSDDDDKNAVALMTLHAAKGLEWPVCFMVGCQEGLIPHQRVIEDGDVTEERRLFYVGLTRARRVAFLTLAKVRRKFKGTEATRPSRFLREIPAEHRLDEERAPGGGEVHKREQLKRFEELRARFGGGRKR